MSYKQFCKLQHLKNGWQFVKFDQKPTYDPGDWFPYFWRMRIKPWDDRWDSVGLGGRYPASTWRVIKANGWVEEIKDKHFDGTPLTCLTISEIGKEAIKEYRKQFE